MKAILATVTVFITLLGASLMAADAPPTAAPAEQQFQQADLQLAIEQYKKLQMASFDLVLKLDAEATLSEEQKKQIQHTINRLQERAEVIREGSIKRAAVAATNTR